MIFSGRAKGNGPFELFAETFSKIESPKFTDVEVHVDGRNSWFKVPGVVDVQLEPFTNPVSGEIQDIQVHMPEGFCFKAALAAKTRVMKLLGVGALSFEHGGPERVLRRRHLCRTLRYAALPGYCMRHREGWCSGVDAAAPLWSETNSRSHSLSEQQALRRHRTPDSR